MALEEVGEVEGTAENAGVVDIENRVPGEGRGAGEVAAAEEGKEERGVAESGTGAAKGASGVGRPVAPGAGPEGTAGDLDGGSG